MKSLKYRILLSLFRILPVKKIMAGPKEKTQKLFRKAFKGEVIPELQDEELDISTIRVKGCAVLCLRHRKPCSRADIYLVGGGMLKYPKPSQEKEVMKIAKECGLDMLLPYYPLVFGGAAIPDVYDMVYELYRRTLEDYLPENIVLMGGSSGGNLAIGLVSYINSQAVKLPLPGKIYAGSPGTLILTDEEKALAQRLEKTDVIMSVRAISEVMDGMSGGREIPEYMKYLQLGD